MQEDIMGYHLKSCAVFVSTVLWFSLGLSQAQEKQEIARPLQAEVRLGDGSLVRMTILQESLDVMTKYGKLTIPLHEIRRIDFGMHLPEGVGPQITEAIKQMGSE